MNTTQWERFFEKKEHTTKDIERGERSARSFYKCAAGCRLQDIYHKSEEELKRIPYELLVSALSKEARTLAFTFYGIEWDKTDEPLPDRIKEIFERLRDMPEDEFLNYA